MQRKGIRAPLIRDFSITQHDASRCDSVVSRWVSGRLGGLSTAAREQRSEPSALASYSARVLTFSMLKFAGAKSCRCTNVPLK